MTKLESLQKRLTEIEAEISRADLTLAKAVNTANIDAILAAQQRTAAAGLALATIQAQIEIEKEAEAAHSAAAAATALVGAIKDSEDRAGKLIQEAAAALFEIVETYESLHDSAPWQARQYKRLRVLGFVAQQAALALEGLRQSRLLETF